MSQHQRTKVHPLMTIPAIQQERQVITGADEQIRIMLSAVEKADLQPTKTSAAKNAYDENSQCG